MRVQPVRTPVRAHRVKARIAQKHLKRVSRRRITIEHHAYIVSEFFKHTTIFPIRFFSTILCAARIASLQRTASKRGRVALLLG